MVAPRAPRLRALVELERKLVLPSHGSHDENHDGDIGRRKKKKKASLHCNTVKERFLPQHTGGLDVDEAAASRGAAAKKRRRSRRPWRLSPLQ